MAPNSSHTCSPRTQLAPDMSTARPRIPTEEGSEPSEPLPTRRRRPQGPRSGLEGTSTHSPLSPPALSCCRARPRALDPHLPPTLLPSAWPRPPGTQRQRPPLAPALPEGPGAPSSGLYVPLTASPSPTATARGPASPSHPTPSQAALEPRLSVWKDTVGPGPPGKAPHDKASKSQGCLWEGRGGVTGHRANPVVSRAGTGTRKAGPGMAW